MYTQCRLVRKRHPQFEHELVTFIPSKHAIVGEFLKVKIKDLWTYGWRVASVYQKVDEAPDVNYIVRKHKQNTGDIL